MALILICGAPGNGKTQYAIKIVRDRAVAEGRPVYFANIKGLKLPWHEIDPKKWQDCPTGSIIIIDEVWEFWPSRSPGSKLPVEVGAFATHRHKGFDIYLITQAGGRIDANIREIVNQYIHLERPNGMSYSKVWTFSHYCDWKSTTERALAQVTRTQFDQSIWELYHSADEHTHKRTIPKHLYILGGLGLVVAVLIWLGYSQMSKLVAPMMAKTDDKAKDVKKAAEKKEVPAPQGIGAARNTPKRNLAEYVTDMRPRVADLPYSAAYFDDLTKPVSFPTVSACVQSKKDQTDCRCYSQQGTTLSVSYAFCVGYVKYGAFDPFVRDNVRGVSDQRAGVFARPAGPVAAQPGVNGQAFAMSPDSSARAAP